MQAIFKTNSSKNEKIFSIFIFVLISMFRLFSYHSLKILGETVSYPIAITIPVSLSLTFK